MKKGINIAIYLMVRFAGLVLGSVGTIFVLFAPEIADRVGMASKDIGPAGIPLMIIGFGAYCGIQAIFTLRIVSKMWGSIQDGKAAITPGKGILSYFIPVPLLRMIMITRTWITYAGEYQKFNDRHGITVPPISSVAFWSYAVVRMIGALLTAPVLLLFRGSLSPLGIIIFAIPVTLLLLRTPFFVAVIAKVCDAVNLLAADPKYAQLVQQQREVVPQPIQLVETA